MPNSEKQEKCIRIEIPLDGSMWKYRRDNLANPWEYTLDDILWETVSVPHTWGDGIEKETYYPERVAWYRRHFTVDDEFKDRKIFIYFERVTQIADVWLNGNHVGSHYGGYTGFAFDLTPYIKYGGLDNVLAVKVDNTTDSVEKAQLVPFQKKGFLPYFGINGGIVAPVRLITTSASTHIPVIDDDGSPGVYVNTYECKNDISRIRMRTLVKNETQSEKMIRVVQAIKDKNNNDIAEFEAYGKLKAGEVGSFLNEGRLTGIELWNIERPALYTLSTKVFQGDMLTDGLDTRFGFRSLEFRKETQDFYLNGRLIRIYGICYTPEIAAKGIVDKKDFDTDYRMIKELGMNAIRETHNPLTQYELKLCDRLGIINMGGVGQCAEAPKNADAAVRLTREYAKQSYNHASMLLWENGNELYDRTNYYIPSQTIKAYREVDPERLIIGTDCTGPNAYFGDIPGWNVYFGWYWSSYWDFEKLNWRIHPETGAEADIEGQCLEIGEGRQNSDLSEEYQSRFYEAIVQQMFDADKSLVMYFCFNDFRNPATGDWNKKGVVSNYRIKKDSFYYLKSRLTSTPVCRITNKRYENRDGNRTQAIKVYSNADQVELKINGQSLGTKRQRDYSLDGHKIDNVFLWEATLKDGMNTIAAFDSNGLSDTMEISYKHNPDRKIWRKQEFKFDAEMPEDMENLFCEPYNDGSRNDFTGWVGYQFTVGDKDIVVTGLGRSFNTTVSSAHEVRVWDADTREVVASVIVGRAADRDNRGFQYARLEKNIVLKGKKSYRIASHEVAGGDPWKDKNYILNHNMCVVIDKAVFGTDIDNYPLEEVSVREMGFGVPVFYIGNCNRFK